MIKSRFVSLVVAAAAFLPHASALDLGRATIPELQAAMASGSLTSEKITSAYLARIAAYDKQGPSINAVITLNPKALEMARALDAERKAGKVRGPLHGIPIMLKDNIDTFDLPTSGGSQLLAGSIPPDDAFVAKKLREAGCVIVAKVNLSEWAGSGGSISNVTDVDVIKAGAVPNGFSSMGGQTKNPHDLTRGPSGSSGGTGASIAAAFAQFGLGTDTGGSVRGPSSVNGIVGLKTTHGLVSRDGIIPLALSFDTCGPMARSVTDLAIALGTLAGRDPNDDSTKKGEGKFETDYTKYLKTGSLKGARIGIARDFMGKDAGTDAIVETAIVKLRELGAIVVDQVRFLPYLIAAKAPIYGTLVAAEFKAQLTEYLKAKTKPGFPKSFDEVVALSNDPATHYRSPGKAYGLKYNSTRSLDLTDPSYLAIKNEQLSAMTAGVDAVFAKHQLDAILYPTSPRPATPIDPPATPTPGTGGDSPTNLANETGYPDLIVPAGMTKEGLPVTISFFGKAFSEPKLIGYAYDFEQATHAIAEPKTTPALPSDKL